MAYDINEEVTGSPVLTDNVRPSSHPPIKINNNEEFASFVSEKGLDGEGTEDNPYLLQDYYINGSSDGCCIYIGNTTEYFTISESHLYEAKEDGAWPNNRATGI
ncbi:MAG: hypothetical protein KAX31_00660, partial [Thermoplasmata archaeon]|nr:hypothetical protein [Thermoplasmata archaeon]